MNFLFFLERSFEQVLSLLKTRAEEVFLFRDVPSKLNTKDDALWSERQGCMEGEPIFKMEPEEASPGLCPNRSSEMYPLLPGCTDHSRPSKDQ